MNLNHLSPKPFPPSSFLAHMMENYLKTFAFPTVSTAILKQPPFPLNLLFRQPNSIYEISREKETIFWNYYLSTSYFLYFLSWLWKIFYMSFIIYLYINECNWKVFCFAGNFQYTNFMIFGLSHRRLGNSGWPYYLYYQPPFHQPNDFKFIVKLKKRAQCCRPPHTIW